MACIIGREPKSCERCKNRRMDEKRFWQESADEKERVFCDAGYDMEAASGSVDDGSAGGGEDAACAGYAPRFLDLPIDVAEIAVPDACSRKRSDASIVPTSDTGRIADVWLCEEGKAFSPDAKPLAGIVIGEAAWRDQDIVQRCFRAVVAVARAKSCDICPSARSIHIRRRMQLARAFWMWERFRRSDGWCRCRRRRCCLIGKHAKKNGTHCHLKSDASRSVFSNQALVSCLVVAIT